ncbi:C-type lectin mannose-binding isoform-like [Puntigrus tetrazona]|uniref:C-type lectin mannose-binding isoform-like n=1 Tax=Puntigrus tetrazona TaxID=1606681 RepID=UPI001C89C926|nr:C-type lectin mannose-binding isoform-like [Puntigrus tetrazona]
MNWMSAQKYCRQRYSDLATVDDQADHDQLLKMGKFWLVLYRTTGNGVFVCSSVNSYVFYLVTKTMSWTQAQTWLCSWVFSDGSKSLFSSWQSSQPNNADGIQYCVYTTVNGYWNDWDCSDKLPFMCYESKIQIVRLEIKSSAIVNDPAVRSGILVKIEQTLKEKGLNKDSKLSWMMFSGEDVFHEMWYQKSDASKAPCKRAVN